MIMRCETQDQPKAVRMSVPDDVLLVDPLAELTAFRRELLGCFTRRRDALFELADAMLCAQGRVCSPAELRRVSRFLRLVGQRFFVACGSSWSGGWLIHAALGRAAGSGCLRTNRSGLRV